MFVHTGVGLTKEEKEKGMGTDINVTSVECSIVKVTRAIRSSIKEKNKRPNVRQDAKSSSQKSTSTGKSKKSKPTSIKPSSTGKDKVNIHGKKKPTITKLSSDKTLPRSEVAQGKKCKNAHSCKSVEK